MLFVDRGGGGGFSFINFAVYANEGTWEEEEEQEEEGRYCILPYR